MRLEKYKNCKSYEKQKRKTENQARRPDSIAFFCGVIVNLLTPLFCPKVSDSDSPYTSMHTLSLYNFWFLNFRSDTKLSRKLKLFRQSNDRLATIQRTSPCWIIIYTLKFGGYNAAKSIRCKFCVIPANDKISVRKNSNNLKKLPRLSGIYVYEGSSERFIVMINL